MPSPDDLPPAKPADLVAAKVPWGTRKPAPPTPAPASAPPSPAPVLAARKVPWGARKAPPVPPPAPPAAAPDATVTHMPWAEPPPPRPAPAAKPGMFAKLVPWGTRKSPPKTPPTDAAHPPEAGPAPVSTWALPKGATAPPTATQEEMEFAREGRQPEDSPGEPTAEQLVAFLSRLTSRSQTPAAMSAALDARAPYKARPISFEPTRWELVAMWVQARRLRVAAGAILFFLALATAYLWRLVSLNAEIDRQWRGMETALRERYALVPAYVECIRTFSDSEHYTMTITERGLTSWRNARTDPQIAAAAARMEMILTQLSKVMRRYDQSAPAKEAEEAASSERFALLERQRELSRRRTSELVQHYNIAVARYNQQVGRFPGQWLAWAAHLHERPPIFTSVRP